jgi:hypothetical protein
MVLMPVPVSWEQKFVDISTIAEYKVFISLFSIPVEFL